MKVRFDARAVEDLREIRRYIAEHGSTEAAERVRKHLRARCLRLKDFPLMGVASAQLEVRVLPPIRYPYRVYYTVQDTYVVILHIRHTSRQEPDEI